MPDSDTSQPLALYDDASYDALVAELDQRKELTDQTEELFHSGHYIYDEVAHRYLYMSKGFARILGTTIEAHIHDVNSLESDLQPVIEADRQRVANAYRVFLESGRELDIEYRIMRADGEIRWVRELDRARGMQDGRVCLTLGVLQDITERKETELALTLKSNLLKQVESISDIGNFIFEEISDKYLYASAGLAKIYGVTVESLINKVYSTEQFVQTVVHEEDRQFVQQIYNSAVTPDKQGYDTWELEYRVVRPDGEIRWIREIGKTLVINPGVEEQTTGVIVDITKQKMAVEAIRRTNEDLEFKIAERTRELSEANQLLEKEIAKRKKIAAEMEFLANHDALTGLPSLRLGIDRLEQAIKDARRSEKALVVMFLDLDGFKQINDKFGHKAGDKVLQEVANRIKATVREQDTVARIGGDEFLVILRDVVPTEVVKKIATNINHELVQPFEDGNNAYQIGTSIGISFYPAQGDSAEQLISSADKAMYQAKKHGKNQYWFAD